LGRRPHDGENQGGCRESDGKAKSPVLRGTHECAETLRRLRAMKVHEFAEEDFLGEK
jgi:hypothetical protein